MCWVHYLQGILKAGGDFESHLSQIPCCTNKETDTQRGKGTHLRSHRPSVVKRTRVLVAMHTFTSPPSNQPWVSVANLFVFPNYVLSTPIQPVSILSREEVIYLQMSSACWWLVRRECSGSRSVWGSLSQWCLTCKKQHDSRSLIRRRLTEIKIRVRAGN